MIRFIVRGLITLAGCLFSLTTFAASLQMYPLTVNFCNKETVEPVYVKNTGSEPIGAQLRVYQWQQKDNKEILTPTQSVIISPPIANIPPGREQLVRLVSPVPVPDQGNEQSYRLIIDELPDGKAKNGDSQVHFLLRYSVPVFFGCGTKKIDMSTISARIDSRNSQPRLVVRNTGAQHLKLSKVALISAGKSYLITGGLLGYVLPGNEMAWDLPLKLSAGSAITAAVNDNPTSQTITLTN
ncbi:pilus assembly protein [Salmonella enterica subsp. enterica serovar Choleraesuis]|nr:pilus assembly protein [Salmonella enterica subsp. enterica serovar Choleraesuis]